MIDIMWPLRKIKLPSIIYIQCSKIYSLLFFCDVFMNFIRIENIYKNYDEIIIKRSIVFKYMLLGFLFGRIFEKDIQIFKKSSFWFEILKSTQPTISFT